VGDGEAHGKPRAGVDGGQRRRRRWSAPDLPHASAVAVAEGAPRRPRRTHGCDPIRPRRRSPREPSSTDRPARDAPSARARRHAPRRRPGWRPRWPDAVRRPHAARHARRPPRVPRHRRRRPVGAGLGRHRHAVAVRRDRRVALGGARRDPRRQRLADLRGQPAVPDVRPRDLAAAASCSGRAASRWPSCRRCRAPTRRRTSTA
jgi:hypothetical protein